MENPKNGKTFRSLSHIIKKDENDKKKFRPNERRKQAKAIKWKFYIVVCCLPNRVSAVVWFPSTLPSSKTPTLFLSRISPPYCCFCWCFLWCLASEVVPENDVCLPIDLVKNSNTRVLRFGVFGFVCCSLRNEEFSKLSKSVAEDLLLVVVAPLSVDCCVPIFTQ